MMFRAALADYDTLCAVSELEAEVDGCETLIEALEADACPDGPRVAHDLRRRMPTRTETMGRESRRAAPPPLGISAVGASLLANEASNGCASFASKLAPTGGKAV